MSDKSLIKGDKEEKPLYVYKVTGVDYKGQVYPVFPCHFGDDNVDKTNWRPDADIVRSRLLTSQGGSASALQALYDFEDGVDTGYRPFRDIGADITEIDAAVEVIKEAKAKSDAEKAAKEQAMNDLKDAFSSVVSGEIESASETD